MAESIMDDHSAPDSVGWDAATNANVVGRKRIVCIGTGALGSNMLVNLVDAGVATDPGGGILAIDDDVVEARNVPRTPYTMLDVGRDKVGALRRLLATRNPAVRYEGICARVGPGDRRETQGRARTCDLLVNACDDFDVHAMINEESFRRTDVVGGAIAEGADWAELYFSCAALDTACGNCVFRPGSRRTAHGAAAPGCDVRYVAAMATSLCLGLLYRGTPQAASYEHLVDPARSLLLVGLRRRGPFRNAIYPRSVIPVVTRAPGHEGPECPVCRVGATQEYVY